MDAKTLIEMAMTETGTTSLRALADVAELDHAQISKWRREELPMTIEGAIILAALAKLRPEAIAGRVVKPRTNSKLLRQVLKEWAKTAAALLLSTAAPHADASINVHNAPQPVYYVKCMKAETMPAVRLLGS